jgi:hypothetical protein
MSYTKMRVEIPENPKLLLGLAADIYKRHNADGDSSPFSSIKSNNWSTEGPKIGLCLKKHNEAELLKAKMEEAYKERDLLFDGISKAVRASRDVLTGIHHDNMKRMSDWGFTVIESPKVITKQSAETK